VIVCFLKQWCSMTQHDDIIRLRHMLRNAREAVAMVEGKDFADLRRERILELLAIWLTAARAKFFFFAGLGRGSVDAITVF
jgi:hypothetical protein